MRRGVCKAAPIDYNKDMTRDIVMTSVTEILQTVEGSCDFGDVDGWGRYDDMDEARTLFWMEVIASKASDTGFGDLIDSLLERDWVEGSAIGWEDNRITEGHHRLVAAILLGWDEVPTSEWGSNAAVPSPDPNRDRLSAHYNGSNPNPIEIEF